MNRIQEQFLQNWHDSFVWFIESSLSEVDSILENPLVSGQDRLYLLQYREKLNSKDILDIEADLSEGLIKKSTIAKIDKLHQELIDLSWDHLLDSKIVRNSLKHLTWLNIQNAKSITIQALNNLQIPIYEA